MRRRPSCTPPERLRKTQGQAALGEQKDKAPAHTIPSPPPGMNAKEEKGLRALRAANSTSLQRFDAVDRRRFGICFRGRGAGGGLQHYQREARQDGGARDALRLAVGLGWGRERRSRGTEALRRRGVSGPVPTDILFKINVILPKDSVDSVASCLTFHRITD